ncbi:Receptor-like cytosolic serine/threonine-protein kinase RBK2 [Acorus calamus]|uniref:Receptor-like cytosolic serine/threonine-protein kinase RBK2 n=1 Tax=Acorus calamus TaxID=4465 RepID=A0AAV9CY13_ACOCL|nr:Receptor-like cytosolic serine/threonine-protein kinase RBK2 [Acorus calamus]
MPNKVVEKDRVIVVLEGFKVCHAQAEGLAPLRWAIGNVVHEEDELLVVTVLRHPEGSPETRGFGCLPFVSAYSRERQGFSRIRDKYLKFLQQQIWLRKEVYLDRFREFYYDCKRKNIKFQVKVAAGHQPLNIAVQEARSTRATWIVMDRCFGLDWCRMLRFNDRKIALVNDDEEAETLDCYPPTQNSSKTSNAVQESETDQPFKTTKEHIKSEDRHIRDALPDFRRNNRPFPPSLLVNKHSNTGGSVDDQISETTQGLLKRVSATSMFHRNVMRHADEGPFLSLDQRLSGDRPCMTCSERMAVAVGVGRGLRYMHEGCPGAPVSHGDLRPANIVLAGGLRPVIYGFDEARWLRSEENGKKTNRCWHDCLSDAELYASPVKSDILAFGVLLLRLFCPRRPDYNDNQLIEWARPLLSEHLWHELVDEEMDDLDLHDVFKAMITAARCIDVRPASRPTMTQVVSILQGEHPCVLWSSPASFSSWSTGPGILLVYPLYVLFLLNLALFEEEEENMIELFNLKQRIPTKLIRI